MLNNFCHCFIFFSTVMHVSVMKYSLSLSSLEANKDIVKMFVYLNRKRIWDRHSNFFGYSCVKMSSKIDRAWWWPWWSRDMVIWVRVRSRRMVIKMRREAWVIMMSMNAETEYPAFFLFHESWLWYYVRWLYGQNRWIQFNNWPQHSKA